MSANGSFVQQEHLKPSADSFTSASGATPGNMDTSATANNDKLSKDEVGWYFVEQYYTTLSKSPEKLHLFYGKRSQFVYGKEAEVANVSVGRQTIQARIKQLDFQDCKVRVSNVDTQASFDNIVIQVIGETSNKAGEPNKFVQTFVLAQQPSGYFVLNDILRYVEEGDEGTTPEGAATDKAAPAVEIAVPSEPTASEESPKLDADVVNEKLAEAPKEKSDVNGDTLATTVDPEVETPPETPSPAEAQAASVEIEEEEAKEPEKPQEPAPTPAPQASVPAQAEPAVSDSAPSAPSAPSKPMTWASRAAAAAGPKPVIPLPKTAASSTNSTTTNATATATASTPTSASSTAQQSATTTTPVAAPQVQTPAAAATTTNATTTTATATATEPTTKEASGWQTAGVDAKRQNRPQSMSAPAEKDSTMGYVKYVTEKVQDADLKNALAAHGELSYFDINRQKNCAFVEFKTNEGYQAAVNANPHTVNGENILVEPRRPKSSAYGGTNYGPGRGGPSGRGRGGFDGSRGGGPGGARGNFSGQNRGRGGASRSRGAAQVPSA